MKCSKSEGLEVILDRINTLLDKDKSKGMQQLVVRGAINLYSLQLNDVNKETEY